MPTKKPLDLRYVRNSDLYPFWQRLKRLGFKPGRMWHQTYSSNASPHRFLRSFWTFRSGIQRVIMTVSPHEYQLKVRQGKATELAVLTRCWSHLEQPFLKYFKQDRPLSIKRIGKQRKEVAAWLEKQKLAKAKKARQLKAKRKTA